MKETRSKQLVASMRSSYTIMTRSSQETVDALENVFNNNLDLRAPDSKFAAIFPRLKGNETLWVIWNHRPRLLELC